MTFEEIVKQVEDVAKKLDAKKVKEHSVYEFDIIEEGHGALYFELINGRVNVQPFEYYDRDLKIVATADLLTRILSGEEDPVAACEEGRIYVEGNSKDLIVLKDLLAVNPKASAKKAPAKKTTTAKKTPAKKTESAKAAKTETKVTESAKETAKAAQKDAAKVVEKPKAQASSAAESVKASATVSTTTAKSTTKTAKKK